MSQIKIKELSFSYKGSSYYAVKNVNLRIDRGEFVVLTGNSGCGKSTLCRCINGLIPHFYKGSYRGEVYINGLLVAEQPVDKLSEIVGYVFQNPDSQLFTLSVEKEIAFGLENKGLSISEIERRINNVLRLLDIEHLRDKAPHELSEGQKQRVAIASVLALNPEIIVLDESTSLLDSFTAKNLLESISRLNKELKLTVILVEHRLELVIAYADRLIVMDKGEILYDEKPKTVLKSIVERNANLNMPKITELYKELVYRNILPLSSSPPLTIDEGFKLLRGILSNVRSSERIL